MVPGLYRATLYLWEEEGQGTVFKAEGACHLGSATAVSGTSDVVSHRCERKCWELGGCVRQGTAWGECPCFQFRRLSF